MRGRGDRVGGRLVVHFSKPRPDVRVYVLGLLGSRRQSCADGPHWLVRDDDLAHFLLGHSRKSLSHVQHPAHSMSQAQHQAHTIIQRTSAIPAPAAHSLLLPCRNSGQVTRARTTGKTSITMPLPALVSTSQPHCVSLAGALTHAPSKLHHLPLDTQHSKAAWV
jgi:hypothetical protein